MEGTALAEGNSERPLWILLPVLEIPLQKVLTSSSFKNFTVAELAAHEGEERSAVALVGRPPVLRGCHHSFDVSRQRADVEDLDGLGVVETPAYGFGRERILAEGLQVQLMHKPVLLVVISDLLEGDLSMAKPSGTVGSLAYREKIRLCLAHRQG